MDIRSIQGKLGPEQVGPVNKPQQPSAVPAAGSADGDHVQISPVARYLDAYRTQPAIRSEKVAQARQSVAAGTMDTDQKLSVAIDRMLNDLLSG